MQYFDALCPRLSQWLPLPSLIYLRRFVFLVVITSACGIGEIGAVMADPPFTVFFKDKVLLHPHTKFLPKVSYELHINKIIHFPPKDSSVQSEGLFYTLWMLEVR